MKRNFDPNLPVYIIAFAIAIPLIIADIWYLINA